MLARDGYPPGVPCWVDSSQPDPQSAAAFYGELFDWELEDRMPADAPGHYFVARLHGLEVAALGSLPEGAPPMAAWNTYIRVEDADATAAAAKRLGGRALDEPFDVLDAGRMAVLADPSGAVFCAWQPRRHRGAQLVNAPGSWNWSDLNTRDVEGAQAFYGALFGWQARRVDFGGGASATMWCLPGYADFLSRADPDLRRRHAEQGAPEGFSDAVAWIVELGDAQPAELPPHWSVTFSVADCDATAERATRLGGAVGVPPFDAGPTRVAVLADPAGAPFTISTYEPSEGEAQP